MQRYGKVKGSTPKVESTKISPSGKPRRKGKKSTVRSEKVKKIHRQVESWEDRQNSKKGKKMRRKGKRHDKIRSTQASKSGEKRRKKILGDYNNFFEYFNLPPINDYSKLLKYIERKEIAILVNPNERKKILYSTNWSRNRNFKLLANILTFEETHDTIQKKIDVCDYLVENLFRLLDDVVDDNSDKEEFDDDYEDNITDLMRGIANLSMKEVFIPQLFNKYKLHERLLTHKYFPFSQVSKIPYRIMIEKSKILSNLATEPKILQTLKKKSNQLIEPLVDFSRQKGIIGQFMQIFWSWVSIHEQDHKKEKEEEQEEDEDEVVKIDSYFIENYIPESSQEMIKGMILSVCEVLENYAENSIRVEVPSELLVSSTNVEQDLEIEFSSRRSGVMLFYSYRSGGGKKHYKPVIYLYPPTNQPIPNVSVGLDFKGGLGHPNTKEGSTRNNTNGITSGVTVSIPDISKWDSLEVSEGSRIKELKTGKIYNYLFWEGILSQEYQQKIHKTHNDRQVIVSRKDVDSYLQDAVTQLGLVESEVTEFLDFWSPILKYERQKEFLEIGFLGTDEWNEYASLDVSPKPDLVIRLFMTFRGIDLDEKRISQYYQPVFERNRAQNRINRKGKFTVVEWGGMMMMI